MNNHIYWLTLKTTVPKTHVKMNNLNAYNILCICIEYVCFIGKVNVIQ